MLLFIALTGGLLAVIFASLLAFDLIEKADRIQHRAEQRHGQYQANLADLDKRLKEAQRLATRSGIEADNALSAVGALSQRFDQHRTSLEAHKRLRK